MDSMRCVMFLLGLGRKRSSLHNMACTQGRQCLSSYHFDSDEMILSKYTRILEESVRDDATEGESKVVSSSVIGEIAKRAVRMHVIKPNSIYVQDAVNSMCEYYHGCRGDGRMEMLHALARASVQETTRHGVLDKAVMSYRNAVSENQTNDGDIVGVLQALEEVSVASVPLYEEVFDLFSKFRGLGFLIQMRADVYKNERDIVFRIMNENLKRNISKWFVDGKLLQLERLTWEHASAAVLERLVIHEKVHRMRSWVSLKQRFVGNKRVYVWKHPALPGVPLLAVYCSLEKCIPTALPQIFEKPASRPNVAVFYSINNMEDGLKGIDLGHSLITEAMRRLKEEMPRLDTFCTLSPIPTFASWVYENIEELSEIYGSNIRADGLAGMLASLQGGYDEDAYQHLKQPLMRWCAQYLTSTTRMDPVARFHLENGASVYQIHYGADLSANGRKNSFGLMVTYMYEGSDHVPSLFRRDGTIPVHENVRQLLT